jgi:predicted nuclease of predicted toxin-antitoxin system
MNSNLRFLIDVNIGIKVEQYLKDNGFDILCVRDINPMMTDKEIN